MMEGLKVVECIVEYRVPDTTIICMILGVFLIFIPTYIVYFLTKTEKKAWIAEVISGFIYVVITFGLLFSGVLEKPTGKYQLKVQITDDVSYVEFTDKYEIISMNDDGTYTIQEKNYENK